MIAAETISNKNPVWRITGRAFHSGNELPGNWRDLLATRLGQRPRRIGILAELALFGALDCMDSAGEKTLSGDTVLRVCSLRGAATAIGQVLGQIRQELPMPFNFLQSQPSQLLPALAAALKWQGDAGIVVARDRMSLAILAARQAGPNGMLLGWVEEEEPRLSQWIRLAPCALPPDGFAAASSFEKIVLPGTLYWRLGRAGMEIAPVPDTSCMKAT